MMQMYIKFLRKKEILFELSLFYTTFAEKSGKTMRIHSDEELAQLLDQPIFRSIGRVADAMHVDCYVVGGYVRDLFLERPSKDIDVVVVGSGIAVAEAL